VSGQLYFLTGGLALLGLAAWQDLRSKRVSLWLIWALYSIGFLSALLSGHLWVAVAAWFVGLLSNLKIARRIKIASALLALVAVAVFWHSQPDMLLPLAAIFCAWLLWEFHIWGGADATLAVALTALFPTALFVQTLLFTLTLGCTLVLLARWRGQALMALAVNWLRLRAGALPERKELEQHGDPAVWMLALTLALYGLVLIAEVA